MESGDDRSLSHVPGDNAADDPFEVCLRQVHSLAKKVGAEDAFALGTLVGTALRLREENERLRDVMGQHFS